MPIIPPTIFSAAANLFVTRPKVRAHCGLGFLLILATMLPLFRTQGGEPAAKPVPVLTLAADGVNAFSAELFRRLAQSGSGNLAASPYSLQQILAAAAYGARGKTEEEMLQTLCLSTSYPVRRRDARHTLLAKLSHRFASTPGFSEASMLATAPDFRLKRDFIDGVQDLYNVAKQTVDFSESDAARQTINTWVAERTGGTIRDLASERDVAAGTRMLLLNAFHFKENWASRFDPESTAPGVFHAPDGDAQAMFMRSRTPLVVTRPNPDQDDDGLMLFSFPFVGGDWEMLFLLPGDMTEFIETFTPENLCAWLEFHDAERRRETVPVPLVEALVPKFSFVHRTENLPAVLSSMGMATAFSTDAADFDDMSVSAPCLSGVAHAAGITVDESGAEAAAASMVSLGKGLPEVVSLDRPFLFMIRHVESGAVVLLGRVENPVAAE